MTILDEINEVKKEEVKSLRKNYSLSRFEDSEYFKKPRLSLFNSLNKIKQISIIAEIKKASPSKGVIRENFDYLQIANVYMENEVDAISVLTDVNFFKGSIEYLREIAAFKSVPLLRKDFIIDEFQIYEAKSNGADAILLIAESLSKNQIAELSVAAYENDLEVLLELHSEDEIEKIDFKKNSIIGINNRNLKTFNVSLETTKIIGELIPGENLLVAESGMKNKTDIEYIKGTNAKAILVGEHLMLSNTLGNAVKELKEWCTIED